VRGGNDRPQKYLVRLKNQPTCSLLQLRYCPSGSKAVPSHEQGLVTVTQVSTDPVGDALSMNSARVARQAGRLQQSDVEALVAEVADTHPIDLLVEPRRMDQDESVGSARSQRVGRCTGSADNGHCALSGESLNQFSFGPDSEDVASSSRRMGHDIDGAVAEAR